MLELRNSASTLLHRANNDIKYIILNIFAAIIVVHLSFAKSIQSCRDCFQQSVKNIVIFFFEGRVRISMHKVAGLILTQAGLILTTTFIGILINF